MFDPSDYYYTPLKPDDKRPALKWGGYPIDPQHDGILTYEEVQESRHEDWAIVGNLTKDLLVIDIDRYKMSDAKKEQIHKGWGDLLDITTVVKTQHGGIHVYVRYEDEKIPRPIEHVDLKGDRARGYVKSPESEGYELVNDKKPVITDYESIVDLPVLQESDKTETNIELEKYKESTVPCIKNAVEAIREETDKFVEGHGLLQRMEYPTVKGLNIYNELDRSDFPEDVRTDAPEFLHNSPSETGANFKVDQGGETFRCWRHDTTGNVIHLIAVDIGLCECGDWDHGKLDPKVWEIVQEQEINHIQCEEVKQMGLCPYDCGLDRPRLEQ